MQTLRLSAFVASFVLFATGSLSAADLVPWAPNLDAARDQAGREGKLLLVHFWSTDCEPCRKVEQHVFSDQRVADSMTRYFVPVKIDAKLLPDMAKQYSVRSWPTDIVMTPTGQVLAKMVSPQGADTYLGMLQQVAANGGLGTVQSLYSMANGYLKPGSNPPPAMPSQYQPAGYGQAQTQPPAPAGAPPALQAQPWAPPQQATAPGGSWGQPQPQQWAPPGERYAQQAGPANSANQVSPALPPDAGSKPLSSAQQWASQHQDPNALVGPMVSQAAPPGGQWNGTRPEAAPVNAPGFQQNAYVNRPVNATQPAPTGAAAGPQPPTGLVVNNPMANSAGAGRPSPANAQPQLPPGSPPLAMEGFCPVTLGAQQKWQKGDARFGAVHRGRTYIFATAEAQKAFLANPDSYSPVLSGIDPVRFAEQGERIDGRRQHGVFYRNQIFLFSDEGSLQRFWTAPDRYARIVEQAMLQGGAAPQLR